MYFEKRESKKAKKGYTWCVKFYYTDLNGLKKRYSKSGFETKSAAQAHGLQMEKEIQESGKAPERKTLRDVWDEWYKIRSADLAPGTIRLYEYVINQIPFMDVQIRSITFAMAQTFMNSLQDNTKGANKNIKIVLSNLFKYAKKAGYINRNPISDIEVSGKPAKKPASTLTDEDINRILAAIDKTNHRPGLKHELKAFLLIGYYTGLRKSELMALEKSDIDFSNQTLSVNKKIECNDRLTYVTERLKTQASYAVIPLCAPCIEVLEEYTQHLDAAELFHYHPNSYCTGLKNAAELAGIEGFHLHLLRHSFVTNLIQAGADPKTAAQLARHGSIQTTLEIYTQINEERMREVLDQTYPSPKKDYKTPEIMA